MFFTHVVVKLPVVATQVSGYVTGYGQPTWKSTHDPAKNTSTAVQVTSTAEHTCFDSAIQLAV